jgi:hypothetical protein
MQVFRDKQVRKEEQFLSTEDEKLRLSLVGLADRYSEAVRDHIYRVYNDPEINAVYRAWRQSNLFEKGAKSKVRRKLLEFPSNHVYDFVNTSMTVLYGPDWLSNNKALHHPLVKQWWVVNKV